MTFQIRNHSSAFIRFLPAILTLAAATANARDLNYDCEAHIQIITPGHIVAGTERNFQIALKAGEAPWAQSARAVQDFDFGSYGKASFSINPQTYESTYNLNAVLENPQGLAEASIAPEGTWMILKDGAHFIVVGCTLKSSSAETGLTWDPQPHPQPGKR